MSCICSEATTTRSSQQNSHCSRSCLSGRFVSNNKTLKMNRMFWYCLNLPIDRLHFYCLQNIPGYASRLHTSSGLSQVHVWCANSWNLQALQHDDQFVAGSREYRNEFSVSSQTKAKLKRKAVQELLLLTLNVRIPIDLHVHVLYLYVHVCTTRNCAKLFKYHWAQRDYNNYRK